MVFDKDRGVCCLVLPLKLGVGLIAMCTVAHALMSIFALFTGDIHFQHTGFDSYFFRVPSMVGALGVVFGFVGLFGVYDDLPRLIRIFAYYLAVKLVTLAITMLADFRLLRTCGAPSSLSNPLGKPQLFVLARMQFCRTAQWSYAIGCGIDLAINAYFFYRVWSYVKSLDNDMHFGLGFDIERDSLAAQWKFYQVKSPYMEYAPMSEANQGKVKDTEEGLEDESDVVLGRVYTPNRLVGYGYGSLTGGTPDVPASGFGMAGRGDVTPAPQTKSIAGVETRTRRTRI